MKNALILLNGGLGKRFDKKLPKQFWELDNGDEVFIFTLKRILKEGVPFHKIIVPTPLDWMDHAKEKIANTPQLKDLDIIVIQGGNDRLVSLANAYLGLNEEYVIYLHEAVRPLFSEGVFKKLSNKVYKDAIVCCTSPSQMYYQREKALNKEEVFISTMPQKYEYNSLQDVFMKKEYIVDIPNGFLCEGKPFSFVDIEVHDFKLTFPYDWYYLNVVVSKNRT